jgi:hypothetical protein
MEPSLRQITLLGQLIWWVDKLYGNVAHSNMSHFRINKIQSGYRKNLKPLNPLRVSL